jgi:hypothetical protein
MSEQTQLDTAAVAGRLDDTPATVRRYMKADRAQYGFPAPDGRLGRSPWWWSGTIDEWVKGRPGMGAGAGRPKKVTPTPAKKAPAKRTRKAKT